MVTLTLGVGGEIAYGAWVYSYAIHRVGMADHEAALLNSAYWTCFTIGRLCTVPLAACLPPEMLLGPTVALEAAVAFVAFHWPGNPAVLWGATVGAGVGVCALYSNVVSLLVSFDLLTPHTVSQLQLACGLGHMTVPNAVALAMRYTHLGHDALFAVLATTNSVCLALIGAVVNHLHQNFVPAKGSVREARLAAKRDHDL